MTDKWFAIEITAEPNAVEAIEFALDKVGALGTEVQQFQKKESDPLTVIGYFDSLPEEKLIYKKLSDALKIYDLPGEAIKFLERKTIEKTDWLAEWKKHWQPTKVGRFSVVPAWQELSDVDSGQIIIRIDPNMAFGTGTHETTQLCLKAIDEQLQPEDSFLDVGTGTGILAIAAAKLIGKRKPMILAIDKDPVAIEIARDNAQLNEIGELVEFRCEELSKKASQFDFVCANLTLDVIRPILPLLLEKTQRLLVLSGVIKEQEAALVDKLTSLGISNIETETAGEWISATVEF